MASTNGDGNEIVVVLATVQTDRWSPWSTLSTFGAFMTRRDLLMSDREPISGEMSPVMLGAVRRLCNTPEPLL
jgi:hypothetical protein